MNIQIQLSKSFIVQAQWQYSAFALVQHKCCAYICVLCSMYCCKVSSSLIIDLQFIIHCALISPKTAAGTKSDTLNMDLVSTVRIPLFSTDLPYWPVLVYSSTYRLIFSRAPRFLPKMGPGDGVWYAKHRAGVRSPLFSADLPFPSYLASLIFSGSKIISRKSNLMLMW